VGKDYLSIVFGTKSLQCEGGGGGGGLGFCERKVGESGVARGDIMHAADEGGGKEAFFWDKGSLELVRIKGGF